MQSMPLPDFARIRVDHIGSLHRPQKLKEVTNRYKSGKATQAELKAAQDDAVREAVSLQEAAGFPFVNDGEFRRINFQDSFGSSVAGFQGEGHSIVDRQRVVERLRLVHNGPLEEIQFTQTLTKLPVKMTVVSADRITQRFALEDSGDIYPDYDAFVQDVIAIEHQIVGEVVAAGCRYVQIDAPSYTAYIDEPQREMMRARGEDPDENMDRGMAADNAIIAGLEGVTFGIHLCRGNTGADVPPPRSGHYDGIAERLFNTLNHDRFLLEYDTERAGTFAPLRFVPKGKTVVLGLVSTRVGKLETADELRQRIDEASKYIPIEQLALSPQCGFSSRISYGENRITYDEQYQKLAQVAKVASEVWG
jgi:5-methyltetrahydropteroyltriglutamate--homocysteine methyltransferase